MQRVFAYLAKTRGINGRIISTFANDEILYEDAKYHNAVFVGINNVRTSLAWIRQAAEQGNPYAQYALGKLYLQGREIPQDKKEALRWLESSAAQGNVYEQYLIDRIDEQHDPSILLAATKLLYHASRIFREQAMSTNPKGILVDSRRRKQLLQKRLVLGHKIDDHEEQGQEQKT